MENKADGLTSSPNDSNAFVVGSLSRQIKFRAWDGKSMMYLDELWWCLEYASLCFNNKELPEVVGFSYVEPEFEPTEERTVVMQFMWVKDADGIEIYEGDILSAKRSVYGIVDKNGKVHEVFGGDDSQKMFCEWDEIVVAKFNISENSVCFSLPKEGGTYQERGKELKWVKIGNVFENPELLEGIQ